MFSLKYALIGLALGGLTGYFHKKSQHETFESMYLGGLFFGSIIFVIMSSHYGPEYLLYALGEVAVGYYVGGLIYDGDKKES